MKRKSIFIFMLLLMLTTLAFGRTGRLGNDYISLKKGASVDTIYIGDIYHHLLVQIDSAYIAQLKADSLFSNKIVGDTLDFTKAFLDSIEVRKWYYQKEIGVVDSATVWVSDSDDTLRLSASKYDLDVILWKQSDGHVFSFDTSGNFVILDTTVNKIWATLSDRADSACVFVYTESDGDGRVETKSKNGKAIGMWHDGTDGNIYPDTGEMNMGADNAVEWSISGDALYPNADKANDIGRRRTAVDTAYVDDVVATGRIMTYSLTNDSLVLATNKNNLWVLNYTRSGGGVVKVDSLGYFVITNEAINKIHDTYTHAQDTAAVAITVVAGVPKLSLRDSNGNLFQIYPNSGDLVIEPSTGDVVMSTDTPNFSYKDSDCIDTDVNASFQADATTTTSDHEDMDVEFKQQVDGTLTTWLKADADGTLDLGTTSQHTDVKGNLVVDLKAGIAGAVGDSALKVNGGAEITQGLNVGMEATIGDSLMPDSDAGAVIGSKGKAFRHVAGDSIFAEHYGGQSDFTIGTTGEKATVNADSIVTKTVRNEGGLLNKGDALFYGDVASRDSLVSDDGIRCEAGMLIKGDVTMEGDIVSEDSLIATDGFRNEAGSLIKGKITCEDSIHTDLGLKIRTLDLYFYGENRIGTNASVYIADSLFVNDNVGIGTTSPGARLHISNGDFLIDETNYIYLGSANNRIISEDEDGFGLFGRNELHLGTVVGGPSQRYVTIKDGGNVGKGTTDPQHVDHIVSSDYPQRCVTHTVNVDSTLEGTDSNGDWNIIPSGGDVIVDGNLYATTYGSDGTVSDAELLYINSLSSDAQTQLDARCLESVFGTAIGTGLTLDGTTLKTHTSLQSIAGLTEADVSIIEATADNAYNVVTSGGNNYMLGSNSGNTALEFKTPANVLSEIGGSPLANPTFTGSFTSPGIDDNADDIAITIDVTTEKVNMAADCDVVADFTAGTIESDGTITALGTLHGLVEIVADDNSLSAAQCRGSINKLNGAETTTLPAAVAGMNVLLYSDDATVKTIDPNGTDHVWLNGVDNGAGNSIDSPGAVGDYIVLVAFSNNNWYSVGQSGVWIDTP